MGDGIILLFQRLTVCSKMKSTVFCRVIVAAEESCVHERWDYFVDSKTDCVQQNEVHLDMLPDG